MISLRSTYLSCALLALFAVPAFCTPVLFTDSSAWLNAVTSPSTITFDSDQVGYYTSFTTGLSLPDNPTFVGMVNGASGYNIEIVPPSGNYSGYSFGNELSWPANTPITSSVLQVTFTTPVTAVSVDLMTSGGSGVGYTAMFYNSDSSLFALNTDTTQGWPAQTFFGLTSDTPFSMIDFYLPASSMGVTPLIDNFSYSTSLAQAPVDPSDTPELGTFLLIASGLIGMALMGRRLRRDVAQVS